MPTLSLQLAQLIVLTTGIGAAMCALATRSKLLRLRSDERRCTSCGRLVARGPCSHCARG